MEDTSKFMVKFTAMVSLEAKRPSFLAERLRIAQRYVFAQWNITQFASAEIKSTATLVWQSVMATWNMILVFAKRYVFARWNITQFASAEIKSTATPVWQSVTATWNMMLVFASQLESHVHRTTTARASLHFATRALALHVKSATFVLMELMVLADHVVRAIQQWRMDHVKVKDQ